MKKLMLKQLRVTSFLTNTDMSKIEGGVQSVTGMDGSDAATCVNSRLSNCNEITVNCGAVNA